MKKRLLALVLGVAVLLSGCGMVDLAGYLQGLRDLLAPGGEVIRYEDMEYTRPDLEKLDQLAEEVCQTAEAGEDLQAVIQGVYDFYDAYDEFQTNSNLAYLRYCADLTDAHWQEEYGYCAENGPGVDAALDRLYRGLGASPLREELEQEDYFGPGFFDDYQGESFYDDTLMALLGQESDLVDQYYDLSAQAMETDYYSDDYFTRYGSQMEALFVELVALRQQIAQYVGYSSYPEFAYDYYYTRDYTPAQAAEYLTAIREELAPLYRQAVASEDLWEAGWNWTTERSVYQYVRSRAEDMGGDVAEAFTLLDQAGLYDITYGENKYDSSFEVFLPSYGEPFVFLNPTGAALDCLTFAHEFGHFVHDYVCGGSYAGIDVAEVFSQGMEYLSLCYGDGKLETFKLADCLCTYVEQAAFGAFEQQVYGLTGPELTVENVRRLYRETCLGYGFSEENWDDREYVTITHFFTNPMYIVSYVVSNDAAFQIYQREKDRPGEGLETYQAAMTSPEGTFLAFVEDAGLESPFAPDRLPQVRETLEGALGE